MDVLLINPPEQVPVRPILYPPVIPRGLLITSTVLKRAGFKVKILDLRCLNLNANAISDICKQYEPEFVGISIHGVPFLKPAITCITESKRIWPKSKILIGGFLAKTAKNDLKRYLPKDVIIHDGDADIDNKKLLSSIGVTSANQSNVNKIISQDKNRYDVPKIDLKDLFTAGYSNPLEPYLTKDFELYTETQRGCPYGCRYCGTFPRGNKNVLFRRTEDVMDEMKDQLLLMHQLNIKNPRYWITDETFTIDRNHAIEICKLFKDELPDVRWRAQTRADCVDPELLAVMKKSGCYELSFGIESLSDEVLKRVSKGSNSNQGITAMTMARDAGLKVRAILIVGLPGDSNSSMLRTFQLLSKFDPDSCQIYIYHPVPGSPEVLSQSGKNGSNKLFENGFSHMGFHEAPDTAVGDMSREDIIRWYIAGNSYFKTKLNPLGDQKQLSNLIINRGINSINEKSMKKNSQLKDVMKSSKVNNGSWYPRLKSGMVYVETSTGGLLCDSGDPNEAVKDDLLRRTYEVGINMFKMLSYCYGDFTVDEIIWYMENSNNHKIYKTEDVVSDLNDLKNNGLVY